MFSNFKESFLDENQLISKIPDIIFRYLEQNLPDGFCYKYDSVNNFFILSSPYGINIKSEDIKLPIDKKYFFRDGKLDIELIKEYAYNSQTEIPFFSDTDGYFEINGEKIDSDNLIINPISGYKTKNNFVVLKPPKFPKPFDIKISGNNHELNLKIQRKPINSIDTKLFGTVNESSIRLNYQVNLKENVFKINISEIITSNTTVEDIVNANYIINSCIDGKAMLGNIPLKKIKSTDIDRVSDKAIEFWDKVYEIEKFFNVKFNPNIDISKGNAKELYELYNCFIEKKPFKRYKKFNSFKGDFLIKDESMFSKIIGEEISLIFDKKEKLKIFGEELKYYSLIYLNRAKVTNIYFDENKDSIIEVDNPDNAKMFICQMNFLTEEDLKAFQNREDAISILEKAEEIDYIEGQI